MGDMIKRKGQNEKNLYALGSQYHIFFSFHVIGCDGLDQLAHVAQGV
jgi:hypothetical protein